LRLSDAHSESPAKPDVAEITLAAIDDQSLSGDDQNDIDRYRHSFKFSEHQNTVSGLGAGCCSDLRTPRKDGGTTGIVLTFEIAANEKPCAMLAWVIKEFRVTQGCVRLAAKQSAVVFVAQHLVWLFVVVETSQILQRSNFARCAKALLSGNEPVTSGSPGGGITEQ